MTSTGILEMPTIKLYFAQTSEKTLIIVCPSLSSSQAVGQQGDVGDHVAQQGQMSSAVDSLSRCVCEQRHGNVGGAASTSAP